MVLKLKPAHQPMSKNPVLADRINAMCVQAFPGAPELATLYAAALRGQADKLQPKAASVDDAFARLAKTLETVIRTHAGTLRDFMLDEQVAGPQGSGLVDANRFRPTVEEVNTAAGMVARNLESRQLGAAEVVVDALQKA